MNRPGDFHPNELISAYLDGELGQEERGLVEEHLHACPRCRGMVEDFRSLAGASAREEAPPVPPDLAARIRGRVGEISERRSAFGARPWWRPLSLAAAALAVATLVWVAVRQQAPLPLPERRETAARSTEPETASESSLRKQSGAGEASPPAPGAGKGEEAAPGRPVSGSPVAPRPSDFRRGPGEQSAGPSEAADKLKTRTDGAKAAPEETGDRGVAGAVAPSAPSAGFLQPGGGEGIARPEPALRAGPADEFSTPEALKKSRTGSKGREAKVEAGLLRESVLSAAQRPRSLLYETPDTTVSLSEDGTVTLVVRGYACSASVALPAAPDRTPSLPRALESLFEQASSREMLAAVTRSGSPAGAESEAEDLRPRSITLQNAGGDTLYAVTYGDSPETAPPATVKDLEEEILRSVYSTFRKALEDRCGPVP